MRCDRDVDLAGHSFGGATVVGPPPISLPHLHTDAPYPQFSVLSNPPPTLQARQFSAIPIVRAVALDPWLEPLPGPGPAPYHVEASLGGPTPRAPPQLLVLNSEYFTLWRDHFARLQDVLRAWDRASREHAPAETRGEPYARLVTLVRAKHVSFSDFGVVVPFGGYARDGRRFLDVICELADAFLGAGFEEALGRQSRVEFEVETVEGKKGQTQRQLVGGVGDIVVH